LKKIKIKRDNDGHHNHGFNGLLEIYRFGLSSQMQQVAWRGCLQKPLQGENTSGMAIILNTSRLLVHDV